MIITKQTIQAVNDTAKIEDLFDNKRKSGKDYLADCPFCGKSGKGKGISISLSKNIAKCFSCGEGGNPVNLLINRDHLTFPAAVEKLADMYSITVEYEEDDKTSEQRESRLNYEKDLKASRKKGVSTAKTPAAAIKVAQETKSERLDEKRTVKAKEKLSNRKSFVELQLEESGLEFKDIEAQAYKRDEHHTEIITHPFKQGTRDQWAKIKEGEGNDMLIYYYDLQGEQVMYKHPKKDQYLPLIRVRWQNPEANKGKDGRPIKYQSPYGSGVHIYIPDTIRTLWKTRTPFKRLVIQEGEKKAEKACKHGIYSVAVMGIHNIASAQQLPEELQILIQDCGIKEVVFLLDSDWNDITGSAGVDSIKSGSLVTTRPLTFFSAVRKFKDYMGTMYNIGSPVEIYFGHINHNEAGDKGIDDLLCNTLKSDPDSFKVDFEHAIYDPNGKGDYVTLHKITTLNDQQIADYWYLNDYEKFYQLHRTILEPLVEFRFKKMKMRVGDDGSIDLAQKLNRDEQFWIEGKDKQDNDTYTFDYVNCFNFLRNRGFYRFEMKSGIFDFVHIENKVVQKVDQYKIKDYVTEFVETIKEKGVLNMLYRGGPQYLGQEKLSNLKYTYPIFDKATHDAQSFYFSNKIWEINADGIKDESHARMKNHIWSDRVIKFEPTVTDDLFTIDYDKENKTFDFKLTDKGLECDFLNFLVNASNFQWRKYKKEIDNEEKGIETKESDKVTIDEINDINRHIVNKLTALGYLLHDYKNDSELKAVICMDGKLSEVGASNGRSGKSLMLKAIEYVVPQVYIPAKDSKLTEDKFLLWEVTEKTQNVFLDDVRSNFDFEYFFPMISGKTKVNPKGGQPFTLEPEDSPKLGIATNHTISGDGSSFKDRQALCAFSDFYNENHKPIDDFGRNFWSEWDKTQWNLFYNLMARCVQMFLRSKKDGWAQRKQGIVEPPLDDLNLRKLRNAMGEDFIQWAEDFFMRTGPNINVPHVRKDLHNTFLESIDPSVRKYYRATRFGKCIQNFCKYKNLHFNPKCPNYEGVHFPEFDTNNPHMLFVGKPDKTGGKEYYTLANSSYSELDI